MKSRLYLALCVALTGFVLTPANAAYTSLHVFGDSLSSTTSNNVTGAWTNSYYGKRYSNGRVWVEVLAQQQGLAYNPSFNISFYGNYSSNTVKTVLNHVAPPDASSALYVLWVNNADMVGAAVNDGATLSKWTADINASQANHYRMITNLWSKGVRTLVMPNAVDLSTIPAFNTSLFTSTVHQQSIAYNAAFENTLNRARASCPGLTIIEPDYYSLLNDLLAHPQKYGVRNALYLGLSIDAIDDLLLLDKSMKGPGTNYIFWDDSDPTALVHNIMACTAQQLISPAQISGLVQIDGSNRLDLVNVPIGQNGLLDSSTNLNSNWTFVTNFASTATAQSVWVPTPPLPANFGAAAGGSSGLNGPPMPGQGSGGTSSVTDTNTYVNTAAQFYRLRFPINWVWP